MPADIAQIGTIINGLKPHEQALSTMVADIKTMQTDLAKLHTFIEQAKHLEEHLRKLATYETHLTQTLASLKQMGA